ncbi:MAG: glycosyltransferase, partial [Nitrospira sp.]|nr:glycosyltransferase [Nitrospira sp.]
NVVLEVLATGIPVITRRDCGNSEVITEGKDGWIVNNPADYHEIAEKVTHAIKSSIEQGNELTARKKAEKFTINKTVSEIKHIISVIHLSPDDSEK